MAHTNTLVTSIDWTQITTAVPSARVQNVGNTPVFVGASTTTTKPSNTDGSIVLQPGDWIDSSSTLAQLYPGVGSGSLYLFAITAGDNSKVSVSHA